MRFGIVPDEYFRFVSMLQKKHQGLIDCADEIKTLFIGSSHCQFGALPFIIGKEAYNYGMTANDLYATYQTLQIATKQCKNLKKVVCFVSFYSCGYSEIRGANSDYCQALDRLLGFKYDYSVNKKHNYSLTNKALDIILSDENQHSHKPQPVYCQGYDFASLHISPIHKKDKERVEHHFHIYEKYKSELHWLEDICLWANEHNLELYLVNSPARSDYNKIIEELSHGEDVLKDIRDIAARYKVPFYDFNSDFNDEDLADTDHLNFNGALKLTRKIMQAIYPPRYF